MFLIQPCNKSGSKGNDQRPEEGKGEEWCADDGIDALHGLYGRLGFSSR